jgi:hypothetical protein
MCQWTETLRNKKFCMPTIITSPGRRIFEEARYTTEDNIKWTLKKQVPITLMCGIPVVVVQHIIEKEI